MSNTHYIPITKVDKEKRLVYLRAASETKDYAGESMDYDGSKPNFEKWSADTYQRSAGKSYGNIREMHTSIAAGKLSEPLIFDDVAKTVDIVVYVSDDSTWQKVLDGVLTGASIGGSYEDIQFDPVLGVKRYIADLTEISLVDCPCNPDAVIQVIKSNGSVELRKMGSSLEKEHKMSKLEELMPGIKKNIISEELKKSFSFDDISARVIMAIKSTVKENLSIPTSGGGYSYGYSNYYDYGYFSLTAIYADSVVIYGYFGDNANPYYIQINYTIDDDGIVTLGESQIVHMTPIPCHDVDGNDEALELLSCDDPEPVEDGMSKLAKVSKRPDVSTADKKHAEAKYGDNIEYADEKNKKYPIDTAEHVRAAASYFGQAKNRAKYSAADQKKIDAKISAAKKKFGIGEETKKFIGGKEMTQEDIVKAMEDPEMRKAIETVMGVFGTDEERDFMAKAKKAKTEDDSKDEGMGKDDMAESKKAKKAKADPDNDKDDDSTAAGDTDKDFAGKKAKKSIGSDDEETSLTKFMAGQLMESNKMLMKRIEALESQPAAGGPSVTAVAQDKTLGGQPVAKAVDPTDQKLTMLKSILSKTSDMGVREAINKEMATVEMSRAQSNPIYFQG